MNKNKDIEIAISSLCDDIATNPSADDNHKRAEAVTMLAFSSLIAPYTAEDEKDESVVEFELSNKATEEQQNTTTNNKAPAPGTRFTYSGIEFVALGIEQGGLLAVTAELLHDEMQFDEDECNDWRTSSLRKYLNEEYIKEIDDSGLLPFVSDLTADNGMKDYGTAEDKIALLSDTLYRKYREYVPKYNNWWWTITPWACAPTSAYTERIVSTKGSIDSNIASGSNGVAPACIFNLSIFE